MIVYLAKRLIIEKGYNFWEPDDPDSTFLLSRITPENFPFAPRTYLMSELEPLEEHFDLVLVRLIGPSVDVICFKERLHKVAAPPSISKEKLIEIGKELLAYTGYVQGVKTPMNFQIWEVYRGTFDERDRHRLKALSRNAGRVKVGISCWAISRQTKEVWTSFSVIGKLARLGYVRYINRIVAEEHTISDEQLIRNLENAGIKWMPILVGTFIGMIPILVSVFLWGLSETLGGMAVAVIGPLLAIMIAIYGREIRIMNEWQGMLAGGFFGLVGLILIALLTKSFPPLWSLFYVALFVSFGYTMGKLTEP